MGISLYRMPLKRAKNFFESLYGLELQIEGECPHLQTLEAIPQVNDGTQQLEMGLKDKISCANYPDLRRWFVHTRIPTPLMPKACYRCSSLLWP